MFNIAICDDEETLIDELKENLIMYAAETNKEFCFFIYHDGIELLQEYRSDYDLIFMDAAKGQYIHFLPDILKLMPEGGVLLSDNVLQDGDVCESRFAVTRRNRTIHARMRDYLYELKHHEELRTDILPVGDGMTISVRISKP